MRAAIERLGISQNEAARLSKVDRGNLSRMCTGERKPGRATAQRLHAHFGVPIDAWDAPEPQPR